MNSAKTSAEIRVLVQQPALPKYRVPFFRDVMSRSGLSLKLLYSCVDSSLDNEQDTGLDAAFIPIKFFNIGPVRLMWHAAQLIGARRDACEVLVLSWNVQYIGIVPALLLARVNGIRTILWGHGYSKQETRIRKWIRDSVGRLADGLMFYDYSTAAQYRDNGWKKEKIFVAPNSLDQSVIQGARAKWLGNPEALGRFRRENGLSGRNIIYIGRVYAENRLDIIIKALPAIRKKYPDTRLLVIGKENEVVEDLKLLVQELGMTDAVRWIGAVYNEEEIAPYMLSSLLCCYPANIGLSIMHAMGYGVPVVTGDDIAAHNPEIHVLDNGSNGLLFKDLDIGSLADRICGAFSDPEWLAALGQAARESILESYTIEKMADGFYEAVTGGGARKNG